MITYYNYREIKEELSSAGYSFKTNSDSEVVLLAFHAWNVKALAYFKGMFSLSIFDRSTQTLYLIRDRFGVKPLYYFLDHDLLLFGSELKPLHVHPRYKKELNAESIWYFFQYGNIPSPHSIFNQTYKVYGDTKKNACFAILAKVEDLDRAFLEAAPRHEDSEKAYFRGMKQPFENFTKEGDSITVQNFLSITTNFKVAVGFSGIGKVGQAKCCVYKILISNGVPYINMVNTTKYKAENEILLPRN